MAYHEDEDDGLNKDKSTLKREKRDYLRREIWMKFINDGLLGLNQIGLILERKTKIEEGKRFYRPCNNRYK